MSHLLSFLGIEKVQPVPLTEKDSKVMRHLHGREAWQEQEDLLDDLCIQPTPHGLLLVGCLLAGESTQIAQLEEMSAL